MLDASGGFGNFLKSLLKAPSTACWRRYMQHFDKSITDIRPNLYCLIPPPNIIFGWVAFGILNDVMEGRLSVTKCCECYLRHRHTDVDKDIATLSLKETVRARPLGRQHQTSCKRLAKTSESRSSIRRHGTVKRFTSAQT